MKEYKHYLAVRISKHWWDNCIMAEKEVSCCAEVNGFSCFDSLLREQLVQYGRKERRKRPFVWRGLIF